MASGANEQNLLTKAAAAPGERRQGQAARFVVARFRDQTEGAARSRVVLVWSSAQGLVAQPEALKLGFEAGTQRRSVAGQTGVAFVDAKQYAACAFVTGHLSKDERRESDPALFVERADRVSAENVRDFHRPRHPASSPHPPMAGGGEKLNG